jgi:hypothetical protein
MVKMKEGAFAVVLTGETNSTAEFYKNQLIEKCKNAGLTVTGIDTPPYVRRGIDDAGKDHLITVGGSDKFDVDWIERAAYACEKGYNPIFTDIVGQWKDIITQLDKYIEANYRPFIDINGDKRYIEDYGTFVLLRSKNPYIQDLKLKKSQLRELITYSL